MKITIKTLQQKLFTVDVEPDDTVHEIKCKITAEQGHAVESQKLIYSGKVLDDSKVVKDCNFKEKDFLVLMVSKPKAPPSQPTASTSAASIPAVTTSVPSVTPAPVEPAAAAAESTPVNPAPVETAPINPTPVNPAPVNPSPVVAADTTNPTPGTAEIPATTTAPTTATTTAAPSAPSDPGFVTGSALETTISNMMEMGFTRDQCTRALRASFNNPERAVEYLFNGIPPGLLAEATPRSPAGNAPTTGAGAGGMPSTTAPSAAIPAATTATTQPTTAGAGAGVGGGGGGNLFQMAQQQHQQRGAGMAGAGGGLGGAGGLAGLGGLGGLGGARGLGGLGGAGGGAGAGLGGGPGAPTPEALAGVRQAIAQNPALLQQAIQQVLAENPALAQQVSQNPELLYQMFVGAGGDDDEEGGDYGGMGHMQPQTIALTPDEMAAIERLQALGFSQQQAAEAYLACGKNEELAANFLFEGGFND